MHFCYVDESGDCGAHNAMNKERSGSRYFILAGIVIAVNKWKTVLDNFKAFRKTIAKEAYLEYHVEFHCSELIDPHKIKEFTSISVPERWKLISEYAGVIGRDGAISLIIVSIDKLKTNISPTDYHIASITALYQAFEEFLKSKNENGLVLFDRANEKQITTHVRKLLGTGVSGENIPYPKIRLIIEDPIFRLSSDSIFVQSSDVVAYTAKEMLFPQSSRKKFNADKIFENKLKDSCFKSRGSNVMGIIEL